LTEVNIISKVNTVIIMINITITITILILSPSTVHQTYYEMTSTDKRSLISENVAVIRIDIHPTGKEPDQHIIRVTPRVSRMTTIRKSLLSQNQTPAPGIKSWLPAMPGQAIILGCLILPPANHLEAGRCGSTK
jgi:hypothetical protein